MKAFSIMIATPSPAVSNAPIRRGGQESPGVVQTVGDQAMHRDGLFTISGAEPSDDVGEHVGEPEHEHGAEHREEDVDRGV